MDKDNTPVKDETVITEVPEDTVPKPAGSSRLGLSGLKRTMRPIPVEPENSSIDDKVKVEKVATVKPPKVKSSTDIKLPKSMRITKKAHTAIATIAMLEDIKQYEAVNEMVDVYIESLDPSIAKLVRNSIKRIL